MTVKKNSWKTWIVLIGILVILGSSLFLIFSPVGLKLLSKRVLPDFVAPKDIEIGEIKGDISEGLTLHKIELKNPKGFPDGTIVRIQQLIVRIKSLDPRAAQIDFDNIRVFLPHSEPIVFSGQYRNSQLTCNVYSRNVSIEEMLSFLPHKLESHPTGVIKDIDLYLSGPIALANVRGTFRIEELVMPRFTLRDSPGDLDLNLKRTETGYDPTGQLNLKQGKVWTKNAILKLQPSSLYFTGRFAIPTFDVRGSSSVGKVSMDIVLLGTPVAPIWQFSSNPPLAENVLMLMFLSGKGFGTVPNTDFNSDQQKLTPDIAKDLADFLLFGGEGGRIAQKFGIKDVTLIYDANVAGIGVKKEVTDYLDVGYQIEEKGFEPTSELKHTLDAEIKLNPNFSVEVDKELYQNRNQETLNSSPKPDDKILLKYKTQF